MCNCWVTAVTILSDQNLIESELWCHDFHFPGRGGGGDWRTCINATSRAAKDLCGELYFQNINIMFSDLGERRKMGHYVTC